MRCKARPALARVRWSLIFCGKYLKTIQWRKFWSHKIECRQCAQADAQDLPSALWAPAWNVQRMNTVSGGGISGTDPERQVVLRQTLDEWIKRSTAGFPATSLGL